MIEIESHHAVMLYLFLVLIFSIVISVMHWRQKKAKIPVENYEKLVCCEYCHFSYLCFSDQTVSLCPQCKQYNNVR